MGFFSATQGQSGSIEVISGPMFSGKTEELIRRVRRAQIARQRVQIFKPSMDIRYHQFNIVSHSAQSVEAEPLQESIDILRKLYDSTRVVAIDEVQFFDDEIVLVVNKLANRGFRVICAGLDLDYLGRPFGPMPKLLAMAEDVMKISAICTICGGMATKTQRILNSDKQFLIGESNAYEARCRMHFDRHVEEQQRLPFQSEIQFDMMADR